MSRLKQLIEELCPDGVEYKELGEICENIISGKNKQRIETGEFPVYGSTGIIGHTDEYVFDEECLLIARVGANAGFVYRGKGKYDVSDNTLIVRPKAIYNLSFGYYQLSFLGINKLAKGGGQPLITAGDIKKIQIPIPPLPVQQEIVNILDKFSTLDASLQAELEARRKQYKHYREQLLDFEGKEVEWKTLGEIGEFKYGFTDIAKDFGNVRFIRITDINENGKLRENDCKYLSLSNDNKEYLISKGDILMARTGATYGKTMLFNEDYPAVYASFLIRIRFKVKNVLPAYYWHFSQSGIYWVQANKLVGGGAQPQFNANVLKTVQIPIPPLSEQERIVGILDKFEALVSGELPAEIAARRKQYEYYREKLLDFKQNNGIYM